MNQIRSLFLVSRSNTKHIPILMVVIALNSIFNLLSLVSVIPLVELVLFDAGSQVEADGSPVSAHSRISSTAQELLEWLGLTADLASLTVLIIGVFIFKAALSTLTTYYTHSFAEKVRCFWVDVVCGRYFYASFRPVAQESTGVIANNIIREPTQAGRYVKSYLAYLNSLFLSVVLVGGMLYVDWRIVAAFFGCFALLYPVLKYTIFQRSAAYGKKSISLSQAIIGLTSETANSIKQVHILSIEEYSRTRIMQVMRKLSKVFVRYQTIKELPRNLVELFVVSIGLAVLLVAKAHYDGELLSIVPLLVFFGIALSRLSTMLANLVSLHVACVNQMPSVNVLLNLAGDKRFDASRESKADVVPFDGIKSDIVLENVVFAYDQESPVLNGVSCLIPHAKLTCFVGPSGSGKSTLMDLLLRLYEPDSGSISCNGHSTMNYRLADWRCSIGYVSQDASTISVSLRENITLGRKGVTDERLNEIASALRLDRLVEGLERGWDTEIGRGGFALSGGEQKRVAIARALLREPDLLIFDEATVSFQEGLEQELLVGIRSARPNISIVVITHRVSAIDNADLVHVLDRGCLVASGSEAEVRHVAQSLLTLPKDPTTRTQDTGSSFDLDLEAG